MNESASFLIGLLLGGLAIGFFGKGTLAWQKARSLMKAPAKAKAKYKDEKKKARESVTKGRKQYLWSIFYFVGGVVIVAVIAFFILVTM